MSACSEEDDMNNIKPDVFSHATIIHDYHKLYVELESRDIYIAPIISSRFLLCLNVAIQECTKAADTSRQYVLSDDFSILRKTIHTDSLLLAELLNKTLSLQLKNTFRNRVSHSEKIVNEAYAKMKASIGKKYGMSDDKNSGKISNAICHKILEDLMPCEYVQYPDLTFRDSVIVNFEVLESSIDVTWLKNMKQYTSFLPLMQEEAFDKNTMKHIIRPDKRDIYRNAMEIYALSKPLTHEGKWIAEFWSDDIPGVTFSPVTRWFNILNQVIEKEKPDFESTKNMYFTLGLALHETSVNCWDFKYSFYVARPSHVIQNYIDPDWKPFHDNPSFPAYPSGHASFGGCAAKVLEHYFGSHYAFTDQSHHGNKAFLSDSRSFQNFKEMAEENAKSRMYLGVHFRKDCEDGLSLGGQVATYVINLLEEQKVN